MSIVATVGGIGSQIEGFIDDIPLLGDGVDDARRTQEATAQIAGTSECPGGQYSAAGVGRVAAQLSRATVEEAMRRYEDCRGEIAWDPGSTSIGSANYFGKTITSKREAGVALASLANGGPDCGSGGSIGGGGGEEGSRCAAQAVEWLLSQAPASVLEGSGTDTTSSGGTPQSAGGQSSPTSGGDSGGDSEVERILDSILGPLVEGARRTGERAQRAVGGAAAGAEAGARSEGLQFDTQTLLLAGGVVLAVVLAARR